MSNNINLTGELFPTNFRHYINEYGLFFHLFGTIPNKLAIGEIESKKAHEWFFDKFKNQIVDSFKCELDTQVGESGIRVNRMYQLKSNTLFIFDLHEDIMRILHKNPDENLVNNIFKYVRENFRKNINRPQNINLLGFNRSSFSLEEFEIPKFQFDLSENYNDDLVDLHDCILENLNSSPGKGLLLLHGLPGSGKTTYIRHLISQLDKRVIFFPPNLANNITDPSFISILIDNPNSILVIEDAESILLDRKRKENTSVSALLNIADGLLADCLNIQIICTFNTDISKVDSALLRKGRLLANYRFDKLDTSKSNALSVKLGHNKKYTSPTLLTEVYNPKDEHSTDQNEVISIGFKSSISSN